MRWLALILLLLAGCDRDQTALPDSSPKQDIEAKAVDFAAILSPLIDPDRLDTLNGKRAATPRLRKTCYWLNEARAQGHDPAAVIDQAHPRTLYPRSIESNPTL